jgi:hypothetical protein
LKYRNKYSSVLCEWLTGGAAESASRLWNSDTDWDQFAAKAAASMILPALQTSQSAGDGNVPAKISGLIAAAHDLNTARNRIALAQVQEFTAALNSVGIEPVALKGLANLLTGIYPSLGARYLADLDLLVVPDQVSAAVSVFESLGYAAQPSHSVEFHIGHTYPPLTRPLGVEVDLHRTTGLGICSSFLPASEVFRYASAYDLDGATIRIPSAQHLVMHHIMHSQMHDVYRERVAPSLRTLYDFFLLNNHFRTALDWVPIERHFRQNGQYATFALYLLEAESSMGVKPPLPLTLTPAIRLRRWRRELLQKWPQLRLVDPVYYFFAGFQPRTRRLREILSQPGGIRYLFRKLYRPEFYARLLSDFR